MSYLELKGFKGLKNLNSLTSELEANLSHQEHLKMLSVAQLIPGAYQPRKQFDPSSLQELADSIKSQGIIQPLVVRKKGLGDIYEIIAGERRWRAAQLANVVQVPAVVKIIDDNVALAYALIENIQRENLNVIEEAHAYTRFKDEFAMTHEDIAEMVGKSRVSITNTMRLLLLTDSVKQNVIDGKINMGHARALLTLEEKEQEQLSLQIVEKSLSVRETEKLVSKIKQPANSKEGGVDRQVGSQHFFHENEPSKILAEILATPVVINLNQKGAGKITIQVDSMEEFDRLMGYFKILPGSWK